MKIHCYSCGGDWKIFDGDDWNNPDVRACPHCGRKIDRSIWEKQVLPAFNVFADASRELEKDSRGYKAPLFQIEYTAFKTPGTAVHKE